MIDRIEIACLDQQYALTVDGPLHDVPLTFADKQVFAVSIPDAFVSGGEEAMIGSYCELYPTKGLATIVCGVEVMIGSDGMIGFCCV